MFQQGPGADWTAHTGERESELDGGRLRKKETVHARLPNLIILTLTAYSALVAAP